MFYYYFFFADEQEIIDQNINCTVLFPNPHSLGAFAIAIVRLLVDNHNRVIGGNGSRILSLDDLDADHLIKFDQDLNIFLLANSRYELEVRGKGQPTNWKLDESGLDRMIYEKFFQNIPQLDEKSAPRLAYIGEVMSSSRLNDKIPQERKLPKSIAGT